MQLFLVVVGGVHHGREIPIPVTEFRIGRDAKCHLRPASDDVSRMHCALIQHPDGRVFLRDYGSSNGTILNRRMLVHGEMQLEDGDTIEVGPLMFRLKIVKAEAAAAAAAPAEQPGAFVTSDDIHDEPALSSLLDGSREPSAAETILVSRPGFQVPAEKPKDAPPMLMNE
jgi:predicted component of type VI protein secretion system